MKIFLSTVVLLLIVTFPAVASEKIGEAFGIKLGQVFNPTTPAVQRYDEKKVYIFTPDQPNPMFSTYLVRINPDTHVVCEIIAGGELPDFTAYQQWENEMKAFLHSKYGSLPSNDKIVKQEGRMVLIDSASAEGNKMGCTVKYLDIDLMDEADQAERNRQQKQLAEEQKRLRKSVDTTGL